MRLTLITVAGHQGCSLRPTPREPISSFLVFAGKELFLFLNDPALESADHIHRTNYDHHHKQDYLNTLEVAYQFFDTGREREAQTGEHAHPHDTAREGQKRKPEKSELGETPEHCARGSQPVHVLHNEDRQHPKPLHKLFDSRPRANEELQAPGAASEPHSDHVAECVADETARRSHHKRFFKSE